MYLALRERIALLLHLPAPPTPAIAAAGNAPVARLAGATVSDLSAAQRRALVAGILVSHGLGIWALLQVEAVRDTVRQAAPIFVSLIAPADTPPSVPQPRPQPPKAQLQPKPVPRTPPVIAAPATSPPSAEAFVVPEVPPPPPAPMQPTAPISSTSEAAPPAPQTRMLPDSAVQYLQPPELVYPRLSQRNGETGLVIVRAYVGSAGGAPHSVQIDRSSGHARLDQAALAAVQKARFKPYAEKGQPVEGWALVPIRFELEK
jgi:periplasmic protein TonB